MSRHALKVAVQGTPAGTRVHLLNRHTDGTVSVRVARTDGQLGAILERVPFDALAVVGPAPIEPPTARAPERKPRYAHELLAALEKKDAEPPEAS